VTEGEAGLLLPAEHKSLRAALGVSKGAKGWLKEAVARADWHDDKAVSKALRPVLMRLCARYLVKEKRPNGMALDPVAHFHLSNGARMERLNWLADRSRKGLQQSSGIMINYRYDLGRIDANHEGYRTSGKVATSSAIKSLLKG
jgi:malonyl-CoA decarboxylase